METPIYAEEAVLGGLLLDNMRFHDVAPLLSAEHFTSPQRSRVFAAIRDRVLAGEPADTVTVGEALPDDFGYCIEISCSPGRAAPDVYANIVRDNWRRREAMAVGLKLVAASKGSEAGAVDSAITALMALNASVTECEFTGKQAMNLAYQAIQKAHDNGGMLPGITTGLAELDAILGGFHNSDLTIIGARPAMGKTALMGNLAEAAAEAGKRPGIISAEQPAIQMAMRRISMVSGVNASSLRAGSFQEEDWSRLTQGMKNAIGRDMWIYDRSAVTLDELVGIARKWKHTHDIGILFIDYAQRIHVPGADRITEVSEVARGLKNLARDLDIPVVSLAQVIKGVDSRPDRRPNQGDLANSDELTREADQIWMLYRDAAYYRDAMPDGSPVNRAVAEILIEKNRHGPTGFKKVAFIEESMRFADLERGYA